MWLFLVGFLRVDLITVKTSTGKLSITSFHSLVGEVVIEKETFISTEQIRVCRSRGESEFYPTRISSM